MADSKRQSRSLLLTLWILLLSARTPLLWSQDAEPASKIYADASKSVFLLLVKSQAGDFIGQGSGFLVAGGRVVTNEHVVRDGSVYIDLGAVRLPLTVEKVDVFNDLALLTASAELSVKPLALGGALPTPGMAVYAIGNPAGLERSISTGVVSGIRESNGRQLIQVTTPISPGSSGGPVLNGHGEVVGVAVGMLERGQNLNFAVPATILAKLLQGEVTTPNTVPALLDKADSLAQVLYEQEFSNEPDSDWQRISHQIDGVLRSALEMAQNDAGLLLQIAERAKALNDDVVIAAAERAVRLLPSAGTNLVLGTALRQKAFWAEGSEKSALLERAEKALRTSVRVSKKPQPEVYLELANVLEDRASYQDAKDNFRRVLDMSKAAGNTVAEADSLRGLVRTSQSLGDRTQSDSWFKSLVKAGSATARDWQQRGARLDELSEFQEAAQSYQQAAQGGGSWTNWCEAASSFALASKNEDAELASARKCVSEGSSKKGSEKRLAHAYMQIAEVLNERGVYQEALANAREATALNSSDAWAFDTEAVAFLGLRRFQEAINASNQAIRLSDGKYASLHFHLGSAYFETENWQFAKQSFEKAAELDPKDDAAPYNVALCVTKLGYYSDAARWYEEVLRRNPKHSEKQEILNKIQILRR